MAKKDFLCQATMIPTVKGTQGQHGNSLVGTTPCGSLVLVLEEAAGYVWLSTSEAHHEALQPRHSLQTRAVITLGQVCDVCQRAVFIYRIVSKSMSESRYTYYIYIASTIEL